MSSSHGQNKQNELPSIPGDARIDPEIPATAKDAPLVGVEASKDTPFKDAVAGHAKYFAGKVFGNDKEVQQGAARLRGEEDTLPEGGKQQNVATGSAGQGSHHPVSHQQHQQSHTDTAPSLSGAGAGAGAAGVAEAGHHHQHQGQQETSTLGREPSTQTSTIPAGVVPTSSTGAGTGSGVGSAVRTAGAGTGAGATSGAEKPREETSAFH
ncbi:unnamed protein product [Sympodiomycopsis kandeliae]